jgi:hypothetical protein
MPRAKSLVCWEKHTSDKIRRSSLTWRRSRTCYPGNDAAMHHGPRLYGYCTSRKNSALTSGALRRPACGLDLSRGPGKRESNAAEQDEHDNDPPCDLAVEASTRSLRDPRRGRGLERGHWAGWPNARGAMLVSGCLIHRKSLADPSHGVLLLRAKNLRSAPRPCRQVAIAAGIDSPR